MLNVVRLVMAAFVPYQAVPRCLTSFLGAFSHERPRFKKFGGCDRRFCYDASMEGNGAVATAPPSALRTTAVILLALIALALTIPSLGRLVPGMFYTTGLFVDNDGVVTRVLDGSPAKTAGLKAGDRIDLARMSFADRAAVLNNGSKSSPVTLAIAGAAKPFVRVAPIPENLPATLKTTILIRQLLGVFFIVLGTAVVLRRRSILTWTFFLYCLRNNGSTVFGTFLFAPTSLLLPTVIINVCLAAIGLVSFVVFTLYFPTPDPRGWRVIAARSVPYLFATLLGLWLAAGVLPYAFGIGSQLLGTVLFFYATAIELLGFVILADTYARSRGVRRQQVEWVFVGFGIAICFETLAFAFANHSAWFPFTIPQQLLQALFVGMALGPLAVAYAIFRHHILDVNFVINRTLVYALVTGVLVAGFALIDFVLHQLLASTRLALIAEISAALLAGFWINGLHRSADRFVDRMLYRRRYEAERRLERASAGLLHAHSKNAVDRMLVSEPLEALNLGSAAVFRATANGLFERSIAEGWPAGCSVTIDADDPLALHLCAHHDAVDPSEIPRSALLAPDRSAQPAVAVPLVVRHQLLGIALYSAHVEGDRLDPVELKMLDRLVAAGSSAYDHLEAVMLQQRCEALERQISELRNQHRSAAQ